MAMDLESIRKRIFDIDREEDFEEIALSLFNIQARSIPVFEEYIRSTGRSHIAHSPDDLTFLPIELFKNHRISASDKEEIIFRSSGTTDPDQRSTHHVADLQLYRESFERAFERFVGKVGDMFILSLLPSYEKNPQSSLLFMVDELTKSSLDPEKKTFDVAEGIIHHLMSLQHSGKKVILFGVSFALLELAEKFNADLSHVTVIETGGMKGRREEITRQEVHDIIRQKLHPSAIMSEYGMTELLSQAYSLKEGRFSCPPWMKVRIRDIHDPFSPSGRQSGAIDIIDLANLYGCAFISSSDLGRSYDSGEFEVLGRMDFSDIRGCNLLFGN